MTISNKDINNIIGDVTASTSLEPSEHLVNAQANAIGKALINVLGTDGYLVFLGKRFYHLKDELLNDEDPSVVEFYTDAFAAYESTL